jgi:hypothetical protein
MDRPRDEGFGEGRPVEPGEARAYGDDPEAVEFRRTGRHPEGLGPDIPASGPEMGGGGATRTRPSTAGAREPSPAPPPASGARAVAGTARVGASSSPPRGATPCAGARSGPDSSRH